MGHLGKANGTAGSNALGVRSKKQGAGRWQETELTGRPGSLHLFLTPAAASAHHALAFPASWGQVEDHGCHAHLLKAAPSKMYIPSAPVIQQKSRKAMNSGTF